MPDSATRPNLLSRLLNTALFVVALGMAIAALFELRKITAPGAPVAWIYAAVAVAVVTAILVYPNVYFRLQKRGHVAAAMMVVATAILLSVEVDRVAAAWERTPAGEKEIAEQRERNRERAVEEAREAADSAARAETSRILANAEATKKQLEDARDKLEGCFSTFGHRLPALEEPVKSSLHNPGAFEHVETILIVPDTDRNNVAMTFRAENAFGAIRTATVKAQLVADDCSVQNVGEPSID